MDLGWDDLRLVLAVSRGRTLAAAGRALGVDPSTVYRRLGTVERRLGASLFERLAGGYAPTALGNDLVATAERMEQATLGLEERVASGASARLAGTLRLTAPDDVAHHLALPIIVGFRQDHPEVEFELVIENRLLNLTRREADIALRPTRSPPPHLYGRRASGLASAVYGQSRFAGSPWNDLPWVGWEEGLGPEAYADWLRRLAPRARRVCRSGSLLHQAAAAGAGLGVALLPCFLGDADSSLRRLSPPLPDLESDLWLLTPAEVRRRAVVRRFMERAFQFLKAERRRLGPLPGGGEAT